MATNHAFTTFIAETKESVTFAIAQIPKTSKVNQIQGLLKNTFNLWSDEIAKIIKPTFIRPHLEIASKVWNLNLEYDSN